MFAKIQDSTGPKLSRGLHACGGESAEDVGEDGELPPQITPWPEPEPWGKPAEEGLFATIFANPFQGACASPSSCASCDGVGMLARCTRARASSAAKLHGAALYIHDCKDAAREQGLRNSLVIFCGQNELAFHADLEDPHDQRTALRRLFKAESGQACACVKVVLRSVYRQ